MTRPSTYEVFYRLSAAAEDTPAESPVRMSEADIFTRLFARLEMDGDFLGVIDSAGNTLQILYQAATDTYWVELPRPTERGSYGCALSRDDATDLFKSLPQKFDNREFPDFEFERWQS